MVRVLPLRKSQSARGGQTLRSFLFLASGCLTVAQSLPQLRLELGFHTDDITSLAIDSGQRFLVTSSADKTVRVWDPPAAFKPIFVR